MVTPNFAVHPSKSWAEDDDDYSACSLRQPSHGQPAKAQRRNRFQTLPSSDRSVTSEVIPPRSGAHLANSRTSHARGHSRSKSNDHLPSFLSGGTNGIFSNNTPNNNSQSLRHSSRFGAISSDRSVVSEAYARHAPPRTPASEGDEFDARSYNSAQYLERKKEIRRLAVRRLSTCGSLSVCSGNSGPTGRSVVSSSNPNLVIDDNQSCSPPQGLLNTSMDDDISSLGGVEDQSTAVQRMTLALRNESARPSSLTREERTLWDAIQTAIRKGPKDDESDNSKSSEDSKDWKAKYEELEKRMTTQEREHQSSLRAIQRVLGDVQKERNEAIVSAQQSQEQLTALTEKANDSDDRQDTQGDVIQSLKYELTNKKKRIEELERELEKSRERGSPVQDQFAESREGGNENDSLRQRLELLETERNHLVNELESNKETLLQLRQGAVNPAEEDSLVATLKNNLSDKTMALESAKMIIASLENASGSLAADMRAKLKVKEDEVNLLKAEAADRQKTLDSLATQLRDLQRVETKTPRRSRGNESDQSRRFGLSSRLEKNMADLRAASVVLESTHDPTTVDKVSDLLGDCIQALKDGIDAIEDAEDSESIASGNDSVSVSSNRSQIPLDSRRLRKEVEEKTRALHRAEEDLRQERERIAYVNRKRDEEVDSLRQEVQSLREQYQTNMEVLMRKERELAVLRDSLKVDDGEVGYISDDATEATETEAEDTAMSAVSHLGVYGPSQAEALATLLAHGNRKTDAQNDKLSSDELQVLKSELLQSRAENERARKQLKTEKESLANAKMIISSLEKANKSMMEDLRSRLQDSNTAIASLLEKSMESEKATSNLRSEIEALRREREEERERHEAELKELMSRSPRRIRHNTSFDSHEGTATEEKKEEIVITETID